MSSIKETFPILCGSVAGKASKLGVKLHNAGYCAKNLNYTYIAMGAESIAEVIDNIKKMRFRGLGVSMPFKSEIIEYLDEVTVPVKNIGACNTVVNENNKLIGYNTDWIGAVNAINEVTDINKYKSAVIIGSGGVARAIAYALKENNMKVYISARNEKTRKQLVKDLNLDGECTIEEQSKYDTDIIVNATPDSKEESPVKLKEHNNLKLLFDVCFTTLETPLVSDAKKQGLITIAGWRMLLHQATEQFKIYTNEDAPIEEMSEVLEKEFGK